MGIKITSRLNIFKRINQKIISNQFKGIIIREGIGKIIVDQIKKGISPVEGQGKYQKYSESYLAAIKRVRNKENKIKRQAKKNKTEAVLDPNIFSGKRKSPVSLFLTGKMLGSIETSKIATGIRIAFKDKKAEYHNEGSEKLPRRAMLPLKGGEFSQLIQRKITKSARDAIKKLTRR